MKENIEPEVGMGATERGWTQSYAYTIIEVNKNKTRITIQRDKCTLLNKEELNFHQGGFCAHCDNQYVQRYSYERNPDGATMIVTLRKNGLWVPKGRGMKNNGRVTIGVRSEFYDYNF